MRPHLPQPVSSPIDVPSSRGAAVNMALHIDDPQVLLEYPDDRVTWHHRVLFQRLRDALWVVVTPDPSVFNLLPLARGCVIPRHVGTTHLFATAIDDEPEGPRLEAARSAAIMGMTARAAIAAPSAKCSLRGGASAARPMCVQSSRKTALGSVSLAETVHCVLRHSRSAVLLPAAPQMPRPQGRTEKQLQGASRERKTVSRPTHVYKIQKIEQLHFIFLRRNSVQKIILQMQYFIAFFIGQFGRVRTQQFAIFKSLTIACLTFLRNRSLEHAIASNSLATGPARSAGRTRFVERTRTPNSLGDNGSGGSWHGSARKTTWRSPGS